MPEKQPEEKHEEEWLRRRLETSELDDHSNFRTAQESLVQPLTGPSENDQNEIRAALEQLRKQLLDLTAHNPLISFKHEKNSRVIRLVDVLPNHITQQLFDGKSLAFTPVPEPTFEEIQDWKDAGRALVKKRPVITEWAEMYGISTTYDLPLGRGIKRPPGTKLQTLHYPDVLEAKLSNLYRTSRTMVEETGTNALNLAFGFLEWFESTSSEKSHFAPLFTIPVALEKGSIDRITNTYQYTLRIRENEAQFNASMAVRLVDDFGFVLPNFDSEQTPDDYLKIVEQAISARSPRWRLHRWGTLTILNFSRLLMYKDLDPANWPDEHALDAHPLVNAVIRRAEGPQVHDEEKVWQGALQREHAIDEIENIYYDYPLVDVADSSQHSALIDAIKGKNLVIQGPPGTGKSQTITNLISAALLKGKKVLFVSEKLAALDVVKNRMERLGLGDFCLELHSHNAKKVGVVDSIKSRLANSYDDARNLDFYAARHGQLAVDLNSHAQRVNRPWKGTGLTVLEILVRCARYLKECPDGWKDQRIAELNGTNWHPGLNAETLIEFEAYAEQVGKILRELPVGHGFDQHPWRGINPTNLDSGSVSLIIDLMDSWNQSVDCLINTSNDIPGGLDILPKKLKVSELEKFFHAIASMPSEAGNVFWDNLPMIRQRGISELESLADTIDKLVERCSKNGSLSITEVTASDSIPDLDCAIAGLLKSGISPDTTLGYFEDISKIVHELIELIERWKMRFEEFKNHTGGNIPSFLEPKALSVDHLSKLEKVLKMNERLLPGELNYRKDFLVPSNHKGAADEFRKQISELQSERDKYEETFDLTLARQISDLGALQATLSEHSVLGWLFYDYRKARKAVKAIMRNPAVGWNPETISRILQDLQAYLAKEKNFESEEKWKTLFGEIFQGVNTDAACLFRLIDWHAELEMHFSNGADQIFKASELTEAGKWILETNSKWLVDLQRFVEIGFANDFKELKNLLSRILWVYGHQDIPTHAQIGDSENEWCKVFEYLKQALPWLLNLLPAFGKDAPDTIGQANIRLSKYMRIRESWSCQVSTLQDLDSSCFGGRLPNSPLPTQKLRDTIVPTRKWCEWLDLRDTPKSLGDSVIKHASDEYPALLRAWNRDLESSMSNETESKKKIASLLALNSADWSENGDLIKLRDRIVEALNADKILPNYLTFLRLRGTLVGKGFSSVCSLAEKIGLPEEKCGAVYQYLVGASLADEIFSEDEELRRFDGTLHSRKLADFRSCDSELEKQTQVRTAAHVSNRYIPTGYRGARVSEHTDLALIEHEIEKQRRHLPVRQLLKRAGKAVQALKPCFMMGPRSVAQYLEPGTIDFDLLVIDEASQMRPADALGAVARCKQLVVVGDSKQLAPTSFFDRVIESDHDDEDQFEAAVSESILDAVAPVFSRRQLRWHYRSKHPSLIAFSNRQFYDNRLMLFPSPHYGGEALGIRFEYIRDGVFADQVNTTEAMAVAERVKNLLLENSMLSVGVATMNAKQRDLIERLLESHAKEDENFAEAWEKNLVENEALFIKNLENVQGDEREIMIISCTYGRSSSGGRVLQRFGPINSAQGGRRLNVLFTRSRSRMEIFSSMLSSDVSLSEQSSEGVRALRGMLRFAETGVIEGSVSSGREPDSDFEISVAQTLREYGYEVECQIGVAGFFIDLAVKHPTRDGVYILGVECDGAAYHSSKSARDRDRIRQDVLENMGWTISRIWSTDWFRDPNRAIVPVLETLSKCLNSDRYI